MLPTFRVSYCHVCKKDVKHEAPLGACTCDPITNTFVFGEETCCPTCNTILNYAEVQRYKALKAAGCMNSVLL